MIKGKDRAFMLLICFIFVSQALFVPVSAKYPKERSYAYFYEKFQETLSMNDLYASFSDYRSSKELRDTIKLYSSKNNIIITDDEFNQKWRSYIKNNFENTEAFYKKLKDTYLDSDIVKSRFYDNLVYQQYFDKVVAPKIIKEWELIDNIEENAKNANIEISDEEINSKFLEVVEKYGGSDGFVAHLKTSKLSPKYIKEEVRLNLLRDKLVEKLFVQELKKSHVLNVRIDKQTKDHYFNRLGTEYSVPRKYYFSQIYIDKNLHGDEKAALIAKKIKIDLDKGRRFEKVAREYSDLEDPNMIVPLDLSSHLYSQEVKEALLAMKNTNISKIIESESSYRVFKINMLSYPINSSFSKIYSGIYSGLETEARSDIYSDFVEGKLKVELDKKHWRKDSSRIKSKIEQIKLRDSYGDKLIVSIKDFYKPVISTKKSVSSVLKPQLAEIQNKENKLVEQELDENIAVLPLQAEESFQNLDIYTAEGELTPVLIEGDGFGDIFNKEEVPAFEEKQELAQEKPIAEPVKELEIKEELVNNDGSISLMGPIAEEAKYALNNEESFTVVEKNSQELEDLAMKKVIDMNDFVPYSILGAQPKAVFKKGELPKDISFKSYDEEDSGENTLELPGFISLNLDDFDEESLPRLIKAKAKQKKEKKEKYRPLKLGVEHEDSYETLTEKPKEIVKGEEVFGVEASAISSVDKSWSKFVNQEEGLDQDDQISFSSDDTEMLVSTLEESMDFSVEVKEELPVVSVSPSLRFDSKFAKIAEQLEQTKSRINSKSSKTRDRYAKRKIHNKNLRARIKGLNDRHTQAYK